MRDTSTRSGSPFSDTKVGRLPHALRPGNPPVTRSIRLRPWQRAALDLFDASPGPDFLAVATPGAGKTTFALTAAVRQMTMADGQRQPDRPRQLDQLRGPDHPPRPPRRLIVVAPTAHL